MFTPFAFVKSAGVTLPISASGGTESTSGSFSYNFFGSNGTLTIHQGGLVDILAVGGGGGGSSGGGGGGAVVYVSQYNIPAGTYTVTRGNGGAGGDNDSANGISGSATTLVSGSTILNARGGGGAAKDNNNGGALIGGGSGGGAGASGTAPFPILGGGPDTGSFFTPSGSAGSVNIYSNAGGNTLQARLRPLPTARSRKNTGKESDSAARASVLKRPAQYVSVKLNIVLKNIPILAGNAMRQVS